MANIIRVTAAQYADYLRQDNCFERVKPGGYAISYDVDSKRISGGFDSKFGAFSIAQRVARMLGVEVTVKRSDQVVKVFYGHDV